jgi:hypothetical protein
MVATRHAPMMSGRCLSHSALGSGRPQISSLCRHGCSVSTPAKCHGDLYAQVIRWQRNGLPVAAFTGIGKGWSKNNTAQNSDVCIVMYSVVQTVD